MSVRGLVLGLMLVAVGCGGKSHSAYCVPGQVEPCDLPSCATGGLQVCKDDWSGYGECTCASQSDGGPQRDGAQADGGGDGPVQSDAAGDGPLQSDAAGDGPVQSDAAGDGPVQSDAAGDGPVQTDAGDASVQQDALGSDACHDGACGSPVPPACTGVETCGDGLDNNCNGQADEGCPCVSGAVQPCFTGPPGHRNVGACMDGYQRCSGVGPTGTWGACQGGLMPTAEVCDGTDNDCNGCVDDVAGCCGGLTCPTSSAIPVLLPYSSYVLDGTAFYGGAALSWSWQVTGGPCDQLFVQSKGMPSFTLNGVQTTTATTSTVTFRAPLSGDYNVAFSVVTTAGQTLSCAFVVRVRGPGLRVELCWDTTGQSDIDVHLHRPGTTTPWFVLPATDAGVQPTNNDDCYYVNCRANDFYPTITGAAWGYGTNDWSPLVNCQNAQDGTTWIQAGHCHNPRLDLDNIADVALPENINVDLPRNNDTYRILVHYYNANVSPIPTAHPMVNVWCGGRLRATYGAAPDVVPNFNQVNPSYGGHMWRVADVTTQVDVSGTTTGCAVTPLHPPAQTSGYWVTLSDTSY